MLVSKSDNRLERTMYLFNDEKVIMRIDEIKLTVIENNAAIQIMVVARL